MAVYFAEELTAPGLADSASGLPVATIMPHSWISTDRDRARWQVEATLFERERLE